MDPTVETFMESAEAWICNGYALDIRYLADGMDEGASKIWDATVLLNPLPPERDLQFQHVVAGFTVGQLQRVGRKKASLVRLLKDTCRGHLPLVNCSLDLPSHQAPDFYSEISHRDAWFSPIHLRMSGARRPLPTSLALVRLDNALRSVTPPFDGLQDVCTWLGLAAPGSSPNPPSITIRIAPPVDLITDRCQLAEDELSLVIHAHPGFDVSAIRLAVRGVPGTGDLSARLQVAHTIQWGRARNGRREGVARVRLVSADQALAVLMISDSTVRRQWFIDRGKARNNRLLAVQHFDRDLRMTRSALLESPDASKFEAGVALLLFLLGFTPALQIETNAPDLVVATPGGRLALVECTTRVADLPTKIGKLVDRRGALAKAMLSSGHPAELAAVLVCRLPKDQMANQVSATAANNVIVLSGEDIESSLERVRYPSDPDRLLEDAIASLAAASTTARG